MVPLEGFLLASLFTALQLISRLSSMRGGGGDKKKKNKKKKMGEKEKNGEKGRKKTRQARTRVMDPLKKKRGGLEKTTTAVFLRQKTFKEDVFLVERGVTTQTSTTQQKTSS